MLTAASPFRFERRPILVFMGVCGSGKTTVGKAVAARLGLPFLDADDFHPAANVDKMSQGIPLTDDDRWPWLDALGAAVRDEANRSGGVIATCSALKRRYREALSGRIGLPMAYVLLDGSRETLLGRLKARRGHYMPPSLLDSQLADLETPGDDEPALILSIENDVKRIVDDLIDRLVPLPQDG